MNLRQFVEGRYRNHWIDTRFLHSYVRKSKRYIDECVVDCLDIGSVEVKDRCRGKGHFTEFLDEFEDEARKTDRFVYIEGIQEKRLIPFLERRGYKKITEQVYPPCMYFNPKTK